MNDLTEKTSLRNLKVILSFRNFRLSNLFWLFAYTFSISGFSFYIYTAFYKLNHSPEIVKSTRGVHPANFSFPAVTICPNIFTKDNIANYMKRISEFNKGNPLNMSEEECFAYTANLHWCNPWAFNLLRYHCRSYKFEEIEVIKKMRETAFKMSFDATFNQKSFTIDVLTDFGVCSSYNLMDLKMIYTNETHQDLIDSKTEKLAKQIEPIWTPEKGFKEGNSSHLIRALPNEFMQVYLPLEAKDEDNYCKRKQFLVFIHKPNEIVTEYHEPLHVNHDAQFFTTVTVRSFRTDESLRAYSLDHVRKCYFEGERKLKFFKTYTKALCEWECLTNLTLSRCGCVKFSMPRDDVTNVCNATRLSMCAVNTWKKSCGCFAPCNDVEYSYTTDSYPSKNEDATFLFPNASTIAYVIIAINGLMETVEEVENLLSYKIPNFIADLGGFLGLFLGSSLLSIMETFYFLFGDFWSKFRSSRKVSPEETNESVEETKIESGTDLSQRISDIELKVSKMADKLDALCIQSEKERKAKEKDRKDFKQILIRLEDVNKMISSNKNKDEDIIDEIFHEVKGDD